MAKHLPHLFLFVFLDVLGFSIILPLLSYFVTEFNASPSVVGLLLTSNALAQFITAPVIGRLSDHYGRRPLLLLCVLGTLVSFILLYSASSITMLFVSRILDGILGGNISLAQAYIADVTEEKDRARGFGILGAAFGLAFIFGPAIGALVLTTYNNVRVPSLVAASLCLLNLLGIYFYLPESLPEINRKNLQKATDQPSISRPVVDDRGWWWSHHFPIKSVNSNLSAFLIMRFFYGFVFSLFEATFGLYIATIFQLPARAANLFYVYIGVFFAGVQMAVRHIALPSREIYVITAAFLVVSLSLLAWPCVISPGVLLLVLLPFSLATGVLNTLLNTEITKCVNENEKGAVLGLSSSLGSLARVLAPTIGAFLFDKIVYWAAPIFGACLMLCMVCVCCTKISQIPKHKIK